LPRHDASSVCIDEKEAAPDTRINCRCSVGELTKSAFQCEGECCVKKLSAETKRKLEADEFIGKNI
jgi:hypothetical protein